MAEYDLEFKDFSLPEAEMKPKGFRMAPDTFTMPAILGVQTLANMARIAGKLAREEDGKVSADDLDGILEAFAELYEEILEEESGPRFRARLLDPVESKRNPIDLKRQLIPNLFWLLEVYGLRPTEASSSSSSGQDDAGLGLTDGAPNEVSTL